MVNIYLRKPKLSDAKRYFQILRNKNFRYFNSIPKNLSIVKKFIRTESKRRRAHTELNCTIIFENQVVGCCGIKFDIHREYVGEIGGFVDETYWKKGIATQVIKKLEHIAFSIFYLKRLHFITDQRNISVIRLAKKCGYKKEGILSKMLLIKNKYYDAILYAKVR